MALSEQEGLIVYSKAINYLVSLKPEWNVCTELCSLAESSGQGYFSDKASHLCSGTLSRQRQRQGSPTELESLPYHSELRKPFGHWGAALLIARFPNREGGRKQKTGIIIFN